MDKCPYCGAEARPGDNFCLNCGSRLLPATPSFQQAQPESTMPSPGSWDDPNAPTIAAPNSADMPTVRGNVNPPAAPVQPQAPQIDKPARLVVRVDNSSDSKEYPLEKFITSLGRIPESDIALPSKENLTSRLHATIQYENGTYMIRDENSSNGTFINGQRLEKMAPQVLQDGDHIAIGEYELIFYAPTEENIEDSETIIIPPAARNRDPYETMQAGSATQEYDPNLTATWAPAPIPPAPQESVPAAKEEPPPASPPPPPPPPSAPPEAPGVPETPEAEATLGSLSSLSQPALPDVTSLVAASAVLDEQISSFQEQLNAANEALRSHMAATTQTTDRVRDRIRSLCERLESTGADAAALDAQLDWDALLQLVQDVINNPNHIVYVQKLASRAADIKRVFEEYQNTRKMLDECSRLLHGLIGEGKP